MSEEKKYKVIISDRAKHMLGAHTGFLSKVSKTAAAAKKKEIMAELRSLSKMPNRYPFFEGGEFISSNTYHRLFIKRTYLVLYQIRDDTVYVDYILDCRQDYDWLIK